MADFFNESLPKHSHLLWRKWCPGASWQPQINPQRRTTCNLIPTQNRKWYVYITPKKRDCMLLTRNNSDYFFFHSPKNSPLPPSLSLSSFDANQFEKQRHIPNSSRVLSTRKHVLYLSLLLNYITTTRQ